MIEFFKSQWLWFIPLVIVCSLMSVALLRFINQKKRNNKKHWSVLARWLAVIIVSIGLILLGVITWLSYLAGNLFAASKKKPVEEISEQSNAFATWWSQNPDLKWLLIAIVVAVILFLLLRKKKIEAGKIADGTIKFLFVIIVAGVAFWVLSKCNNEINKDRAADGSVLVNTVQVGSEWLKLELPKNCNLVSVTPVNGAVDLTTDGRKFYTDYPGKESNFAFPDGIVFVRSHVLGLAEVPLVKVQVWKR